MVCMCLRVLWISCDNIILLGDSECLFLSMFLPSKPCAGVEMQSATQAKVSVLYWGGYARLQAWLLSTDTSRPCTKNWELIVAVSEPIFVFTGKAFIVIDGNCITCLKK